MPHDLAIRLDNWSRAWRTRPPAIRVASAEGGYRNRWAVAWDSDPVVGTAPDRRPRIDYADATIIENAVCSIDLYHHALLKAWYVKRLAKHTCMDSARIAAGRKRVRSGDFDAEHAMAKALVDAVLANPVVMRKDRARERVRAILGLAPLPQLA